MYNIIFYALLFLVIPLGLYLLFSWAVLYHILRYGFKKGTNRKIALIYCLVMFALSLFLIQKFFAVDWGSVNLTDFLDKFNLNIFIRNYGNQ
jgi:hypothetical protein